MPTLLSRVRFSKGILSQRTLIIHPYFFALYAGLAVLAKNFAEIGLAGLRAVIVILLSAVILTLLLNFAIKNRIRAGLTASGFVVLIFFSGHTAAILEQWLHTELSHLQSILLVCVWVLLYLAWIYWIFKRARNLELITSYLNWVSLILILFPVYQISTFYRQASASTTIITQYQQQLVLDSGISQTEMTDHSRPHRSRPDIYYIILDGYTRTDVLRDLYGYDNSWFIHALEERGFYIASSSRSNYAHTSFSIASSLNMTHISTMADFFRREGGADDPGILKGASGELISTNQVNKYLRQQGYTIVAFDSGYNATRVDEADLFIQSPEETGINGTQMIFELMLLDTTIGRLYMKMRGDEFSQLKTMFDKHRSRILFTINALPSFASQEGDYFVYAHIVSPHSPFVFGPNGEERTITDPFTLLDAHPGNDTSPGLYRDQLHYISSQVLIAIDQILAESDIPPIIILQADHSSKVYHQLNPVQDVRMKLLFPILNAYYLPGVGKEKLYTTITPVNSFRSLFNLYFDAHLPLLPDDSYVLEKVKGQWEFINACKAYQACTP
jgi:hypothetical protein